MPSPDLGVIGTQGSSMPGVLSMWSRLLREALVGCWGGRRQVESQRVKLEQVGESAGMHVPQLVLDCKSVKSVGSISAD